MKIDELSNLLNNNKLRILKAIYHCSETNICACDLVDRLGIPKNLLSYHIKSLKEAGYIEDLRCGRFKRYKVRADKMSEIRQILKLIEII